jgi:SHS2 domain-containing protein
MIPYRPIEHTADVGLEIYGSTIEELFINSVKGLFHLISPQLEVAGEPKVFPERLHPTVVELTALTQEELLVHWLNEFIYNFFVKGVFPKTIRVVQLKGKNMRAEVEYNKYSKALPVSLEVKAATYHDLTIRRVDNKYQARVIFDV